MRTPKTCPKCNLDVNLYWNMLVENTMYDNWKKWFCAQCSHFFNCKDGELHSWYDDLDFESDFISPIKIADIIYDDWWENISTEAKPYVEALFNLSDFNDSFWYDSADTIITYFLMNSTNWKWDIAKKVKKALKRLIKEK